MKTLLLISLLLPGLNYARSTGGGNGGLIQEMRDAEKLASHFLTREEIEDLLHLDGRQLKETLLQPITKALDTNEIKDPKAQAIWSQMKGSKDVSLAEDINYTRMEVGECPNQQDLCTGDSHYSTIYFDVEKILSKKTTIAELTGMVFHELSHHFAGEMDHPYYPLANFIKNRVASGKIGQRVFDVIQLTRMEGIKGFIGLADPALYCQSQGYEKMVNYKTVSKKNFDREFLGAVSAYRLEYNGFPGKSYDVKYIRFYAGSEYVSEITCE
ncbi:MAG: hypothetical protein KC478_03310 [Bacteriovoracaceae bacterium]|nr:hypothetical protein [Bacteriovoracaceae bacterium]